MYDKFNEISEDTRRMFLKVTLRIRHMYVSFIIFFSLVVSVNQLDSQVMKILIKF